MQQLPQQQQQHQQQQRPSTFVAGQAFAPIPNTSPLHPHQNQQQQPQQQIPHQQHYPAHHHHHPQPHAHPQPPLQSQQMPRPPPQTRKRLPDVIRVKKLTEELSAKVALPERVASGSFKRFRMDDKAHDSLLAYATEVAGAVLEEASLLTKHRQGDEVTIADLKLIFGKKYNIDAKGYQSRDKRREASATTGAVAVATTSSSLHAGDSSEAEHERQEQNIEMEDDHSSR